MWDDKPGGPARMSGSRNDINRLMLTAKEYFQPDESDLADNGNGSKLVRKEEPSSTEQAQLSETLNMISSVERRDEKLDEFVNAVKLTAKYFGEHGLRVRFGTKLDSEIDAKGKEVVPLEIVNPIIDALNKARRSIWTGFKKSVDIRDVAIPSSAVRNALAKMSKLRTRVIPDVFLSVVAYVYAHRHDEKKDSGGNGKGDGTVSPPKDGPDREPPAFWGMISHLHLRAATDLGIPCIPSLSAQMLVNPFRIR